jgi:DNA polymerase III epsilon subunit-like protein
VVVDVETSGVNPFIHDVLAVGLVPLASEIEPCTVYVRPSEVKWSAYARANFAKYAQVWETEAVAPSVACAMIESYFARIGRGEKVTLIGHNIGFDLAFLRKLAFLAGKDEIAGASHRALDTHTILYLLHLGGQIPADAVTSDGAFRHFEINVPERLRHTAIGDAVATRDLFQKLLQLLQLQRNLELAELTRA